MVDNVESRDRQGTVITHTQGNRWCIQFDRTLPSGKRRATFDRSEFIWLYGGPERE